MFNDDFPSSSCPFQGSPDDDDHQLDYGKTENDPLEPIITAFLPHHCDVTIPPAIAKKILVACRRVDPAVKPVWIACMLGASVPQGYRVRTAAFFVKAVPNFMGGKHYREIKRFFEHIPDWKAFETGLKQRLGHKDIPEELRFVLIEIWQHRHEFGYPEIGEHPIEPNEISPSSAA